MAKIKNNKKNTKSTKKQMKSKSAVKKQNQFRVEYKDRVSRILASTLTENSGNPSNGPENTTILIPEALNKLFTQGTSNGEVDGNAFNPRFLNMKVNLNFDDLPAYVTSGGGADPVPQQYSLYVRSGLVLQDISESLTGSYVNPTSGRTQAAFPDASVVPALWDSIAKKFVFNARIQPDFLSYEKRQDTQVRILSTRRVLGDTTAKLQSGGSLPASNGRAITISPEKHMTFNWKMPKNKTSLYPALTGSTLSGVVPAKMWVPFVAISLDRNVVDDDIATHPLNITSISHFTYTDS